MPTSSPLTSPLRYPGSKRRLAGYIEQALKRNSLRPALYIEPFVGGASVALHLLQSDLVGEVILMDIDPWIASFWKAVFFDTDWLVEKIRAIDVSLQAWTAIRGRRPRTVREQAWTCFFLNRTNFSGILEKKVGPLGGRGQTSDYAIDCRFPKATLIDRIRRIARLRSKIKGIWCTSWESGMVRLRAAQLSGQLPSTNLLFYLDPPFFLKAQDLYRYYFKNEDHRRLRDYLLQLKDKWILSYDSVDEVLTLYGDALRLRTNGTHHRNVELRYSLAKVLERSKRREVILSNLAQLPEPIAI